MMHYHILTIMDMFYPCRKYNNIGFVLKYYCFVIIKVEWRFQCSYWYNRWIHCLIVVPGYRTVLCLHWLFVLTDTLCENITKTMWKDDIIQIHYQSIQFYSVLSMMCQHVYIYKTHAENDKGNVQHLHIILDKLCKQTELWK